MKKNLLTVVAFASVCFFSQAQQFENGNFELWEDVGTPQIEPTDWSSLKTADALAGTTPQVLTQEVGRGNTGYCIKLEVKTVLGIAANGIATSGRVHADFNPSNGYVFTDVADPKWNSPIATRPDSLVGWYKYEPQNNDKGKIEVVLHSAATRKIPSSDPTGLIGSARFNATAATPTWTRFSVPFHYVSTDAPVYLLSVIAAGDSTLSKNGTKLWMDDLELIYNSPTSSISENELENMNVYFTENSLKITNITSENGSIRIFNLEGKEIYSGVLKPETTFENESGIYFVHLQVNNAISTRKVFK